MPTVHKPVLLDETLDLLNLKPGDNVIDCTLGAGGHTLAILERTAPEGKVLAIDADKTAVRQFNEKLKTKNEKLRKRITQVNDNFRNLKEIHAQKFCIPVSAVLLDLGLSSDQLAAQKRGFSFQQDGPLDMRFVRDQHQLTAQVIVNKWPLTELERVFRVYGEEKRARAIAEAIVTVRRRKPIKTTSQLMEIVLGVGPRARRAKPKIHPAIQVFQALRIAVNDELGALADALATFPCRLKPGGRLAVISFHSLEDRLVKNAFRDDERLFVLTKKPIRPTDAEVSANPRSRSARLRVAERKEE